MLSSSPFLATALVALLGHPSIGVDHEYLVHPTTHSSASGRYRLTVEPGQREGAGSGDHALFDGEKELWSVRKPYTLREVVVSEAGLVAGYAYSKGMDGYADGDVEEEEPGVVRLVILDREGKEILDESMGRRQSPNFGGLPLPLIEGLFLMEDLDRLVVRVENHDRTPESETWHTFQLLTGERLGEIDPFPGKGDPRESIGILTTKPLIGAPLILAHWWFRPERTPGSRFTLHDLQGREVWSLVLEGDLVIRDDPAREQALKDAIFLKGCILGIEPDGGFSLHHIAEALRVNYRVKAGPDGQWQVHRESDEPREPPKLPDPERPALTDLSHLPIRTPLRLEDIVLEVSSPPATPVRFARNFCWTPSGKIALVQDREVPSPRLTILNPDGTVHREVSLAALGDFKRRSWHVAWFSGERGLVTRSGNPGSGWESRAWWVEPDGSLEKIPAFRFKNISSIQAGPEGHFAVVPTYEPYGRALVLFDPGGQPLWSIQKDSRRLRVAEDVTWLPGGKLAVLDPFRDEITVLNRKGKPIERVSLEAIPGIDDSYYRQFTRDDRDGWLIPDVPEKHAIQHVSRNVQTVEVLRPRFPDGRRPDLQTVRVAPDGEIWISDGHCLLRIDSEGIVRQVIGNPPDPEYLVEGRALELGPDGNLYLVDRRTGAIHIFDEKGKRLEVLAPGVTDFVGDLLYPEITIDAKKNIYLQAKFIALNPYEYIHLRRGVGRVGKITLEEDQFWHPNTVARRDGKGGWAERGEALHAVDDQFRTRFVIGHRPDRRWFGRIQEFAVAPDGSLAILSHPFRGDGSDEHVVSFYDGAGKPTGQRPVPTKERSNWWSWIVHDGTRTILRGGPGLWLLTEGSPPTRLKLDVEDDNLDMRPVLTPGEKPELWFYRRDQDVHRILRYRL